LSGVRADPERGTRLWFFVPVHSFEEIVELKRRLEADEELRLANTHMAGSVVSGVAFAAPRSDDR
jgi:hypothetical protein